MGIPAFPSRGPSAVELYFNKKAASIQRAGIPAGAPRQLSPFKGPPRFTKIALYPTEQQQEVLFYDKPKDTHYGTAGFPCGH